MTAKEAIETLDKKRKDLECRGFMPKHLQLWYCIMPNASYDALIDSLFFEQGVEDFKQNKNVPWLKYNGFWLIPADVYDFKFVGDL